MFWIITGYKDSTTGNPKDAKIYLRDVAMEYHSYVHNYDKITTIEDFFDDSGFSKLQLFFIKRN